MGVSPATVPLPWLRSLEPPPETSARLGAARWIEGVDPWLGLGASDPTLA